MNIRISQAAIATVMGCLVVACGDSGTRPGKGVRVFGGGGIRQRSGCVLWVQAGGFKRWRRSYTHVRWRAVRLPGRGGVRRYAIDRGRPPGSASVGAVWNEHDRLCDDGSRRADCRISSFGRGYLAARGQGKRLAGSARRGDGTGARGGLWVPIIHVV